MKHSFRSGMRIVTVKLPDKFIEAMDELVVTGRYTNRSEIIRLALNEFLRKELFMET